MKRILSLTALLLTFFTSMTQAQTGPEILESSGVQGGLVVHLGCNDAELTVALRANDSYLVHGLDTDPDQVAAAREQIQELGLSGPVSVSTFDGEHLPYVDNLVNLLVAEELDNVTVDEVMRVLAPQGVAYIGGKKFVKPLPNEIDDWSHFLQGPDNNPVANDSVVSTPRRLKWTCGPLWARSHEFLSSLAAMVSAEGRIFYVVDEGLPGTTDAPLPERWMLTCRDAQNGVLLWKFPLEGWGAEAWGKRALRSTPQYVPASLVAGGGRLFIILDKSGPVSVLDAATGEHLTDYPDTENTQAMRFLDGVLLIKAENNRIIAIDVDSSQELWRDEGVIESVIAASNEKAYYLNSGRLICCGLKDGRVTWQKNGMSNVSQLLIDENHLIMKVGGRIQSLKADSGEENWTVPVPSQTPYQVGTRTQGSRGGGMFVANNRICLELDSLDLETGELMEPLDASDVHTPGHHPRCYTSKATENYLITPNRGVEFVSLMGEPNTQNDWIRGPCTFGILPCNGLLYVPPNPCFCYPGVKLTGFNAFAGLGEDTFELDTDRLETGFAYGLELSNITTPTSEWPQYRQGAGRTGGVETSIDTELDKQWEIELGGRLTQPVIAAGRVYIASKDTHTLYVLDDSTGEEVWTYTAGGRIDSPPTVHGPRVLFGCADGTVYCLRASDGELVWRFRAAPSDRKIVAYNQLESPWRVHGSILVVNDTAYFTAGRSSNLDGGILVYALDPATGNVLHETRLDSWARTRVDAIDKPFIPGYHMEGAFSDILVSAGNSIYLGQYRLDLALNEEEVPYVPFTYEGQEGAMGMDELLGQPYVQQMDSQDRDERIQSTWQVNTWPIFSEQFRKEYGGNNCGDRSFGRHVFATGGFLDDAYFNRTYWMNSETWPGFHLANRSAKAGQILTVDENNTYAIQAFPRRNVQSPLFTPGEQGYLLFADDNENEPVIPDYTRGVPKGIGFTRVNPPEWFHWIPIRVRAMVAAENALFIAGPPDVLKEGDPMASFDGRMGAELWAVSKQTGETISEIHLDAPPIFDGMSAAAGGLFVSTTDGKVICYGADK
jgi:outer membrane protein assembly factor BamB